MSIIGHSSRLGIALVYGQLSMTVRESDGKERSRVALQEVNGASQLAAALDALWLQIGGFTGETASFLFASTDTALVSVRHPAMSSKELRAFLGRKAKAEWKHSHYEPLWSYSSVESLGRGEPSSLLHLCPADIVMALLVWFRKRNLQPRMALTAPAAIFGILQQQNDGLHMVLVNTGVSTVIAVGTNTGHPVLVRELARSWNDDDSDASERIAREAQRTILYSRQQMGGALQSIAIYGKGALDLKPGLVAVTELPVICHDEVVPWASLCLQRKQETENLFPAKLLGHKRRRSRSLIILLSSLAFALIAVFTDWRMEIMIHTLQNQLQTLSLQDQKIHLLAEQGHLQEQKILLEHNVALNAVMHARTPPPLPAWVAGFAADALPDDLLWSKMRVEYDTLARNWNVRIEGTAPRDPLHSARLLAEYQKLLSSPRTGITIKTPWRVAWIKVLRTGGTWEADNLRKAFVIEGGIE